MHGGLFFEFGRDARTPRAHPCGKKKTDSQITSGVPACETLSRDVETLSETPSTRSSTSGNAEERTLSHGPLSIQPCMNSSLLNKSAYHNGSGLRDG
jgi:hypothetical protein